MEQLTEAALELWIHLCPLRERRVKKGMTQHQLAALAGVGRSTIANYELGKARRPRYGTLRELALALKILPSRLSYEIRGWLDERPDDVTAKEFLENVSSYEADQKSK